MPPRMTNPFAATQIFVPRIFEVNGLTQQQVENGASYAQPIARLRPGTSLAQATAELAALSRAYGEEFSTKLDAQNLSEPRLFTESLVGNLRPTLYLLLGAVGFVLLIACANVASLFLGRLSARHKEIAVRQSLGATRAIIVRQFLLESLLFSAVAGVLGVLLAMWSLAALQSLVAAQLPPNVELSVDPGALLFTVGVTALSSLLVGLVPALQASKTQLVETLKDAGRGTPGGAKGKKFRSTLVVVEVALSVVLLVGSSLLLLSFLRLQRTPPGFQAEGVAAAFVGISPNRYRTEAERAQFFAEVIEQLQQVPQVKAAAVAIGLPLSGFAPISPYSISGQAILPLAQRPLAGLRIVSEDYFRLLSIPLREGRGFTPQDREGAPAVCIINESFARRLFPHESSLGKVLLRGRDAEIPMEIIGVVGDVKANGLAAPVPDEIYYPFRQLGRPTMAVVARTDGDPAALQAFIRTAVATVDREQPISFFSTMEATLAQSLGVQRIVASLTTLFAGIALVLAAIGLYSVLAYAVAQRTGEIGLRMALGAQRGQVVGLIMRGGLSLVALGLVIGLAIAAGAARLIQSQLFSVQPLDPLVYGGVAVLFVLVATVACLLPSLRASRIDPLEALRTD
jgi:predicted permease